SLDLNDSSVYFSIDGGATNRKNFNTNQSEDLSDWDSSDPTDSFNASTGPGVATSLSLVGLTALDILGYDPRTTFHGNEFVSWPTTQATSFTFVVQGLSGGFIDPVATANDPNANAFAYVNQNIFRRSGTTSVTVSLDDNGNSVITYSGSHPI